jgi:hypothetical protein
MSQPFRIGDAEREQAATRLADAYAEGRLDHDEYDERLDAVWTARTHEDLALIFHDLPLPVAPPPPPPKAAAGWSPPGWAVACLVVAALLLIAAEPFLAIALGVLALVLLKHRARRRWQHHAGGRC